MARVLPSQQEPVLWSQQALVLPLQQELAASPPGTTMQVGPMAQAASALVLPSQQELAASPPEPVRRQETVSARPVAPPWPGRPLRPAAPVQVPQAWLQAWARVWLGPRVQASIRAWGSSKRAQGEPSSRARSTKAQPLSARQPPVRPEPLAPKRLAPEPLAQALLAPARTPRYRRQWPVRPDSCWRCSCSLQHLPLCPPCCLPLRLIVP